MTTKALNYTTAEINQRLNLAGIAAQTSADNQADIAGLKSKTGEISKQSTESEEEAVIYETDGGVQVGKIDANGADFANLKRGGQQVARMSDLPTKDSSIGENPSTTNVPTTKAVKDYVDAHSGGDYPIETETTSSEDEEQVWGNDEETQEYVKIGSYGMKSKEYLDMSGNSVIPTKDTAIGETPSQINIPTSKAVADYVATHGGGNPHISDETIQSDVQEIIFGNSAETQEYVRAGNYGLKAKGYYDLEGNKIGKEISTPILLDEDFATSTKLQYTSGDYSVENDCIESVNDAMLKITPLYALSRRRATLLFKPTSASDVVRFGCVPPVVSTTGTAIVVDFGNSVIKICSVTSDGTITVASTVNMVNVSYVSGHKYILELKYDCPNNYARIIDYTTNEFDEFTETYVDGNNHNTGNHKGRYFVSASAAGVSFYNIRCYSLVSKPWLICFGASQNEATYFYEDYSSWSGSQSVPGTPSTPLNGYAYKICNALQNGHKGLVSGISGSSWNEVKQRLESEALILMPEYVIIMVGNNSWSDNVANQCVQMLKDKGIKLLLFNLPAAYLIDGTGGITGSQDDAAIRARNDKINALREANQLDGARVDLSNSLNHDGQSVDTSLAFYTYGYFPHPNHTGTDSILARVKSDCPYLFNE